MFSVMDVSRATQVQSIPRQMERKQSLCECYHAIVLFCLGDEPAWDGDEQRLPHDDEAISWADLYATCEGRSPTGILARI